MDYTGKKLLLLGGSKPYIKLAKAAKGMGIDVIVVDQHKNEEIIPYADTYLQLSLLDSEGIGSWCEEHHVDGIINFCVDFAQRTYQKLCERFDLPCCYNKHQVDLLANKTLFKKMLAECGLNTINSYSIDDINEDRVKYPIIIKPSESSGSRGATTCKDKNEAMIAAKKAMDESRSGDIIIEEYIKDAQEVQITYFLCHGNTYVIRTADSYEGNKEDGLERVVACSISPSRYTDIYFNGTHDAVLKMVEKLGLHDGPFFMQGFFHENEFKFFDPGCRFPGVDFDSIYNIEYNIDIAKMMVCYSLTGEMPDLNIPTDMWKLNGKMAAVLFPVMKPGIISEVNGLETLSNNPNVFSISRRHIIGDEISYTYDVNQRYGEFDVIADDLPGLKDNIENIQNILNVKNACGDEMIYSHFDVKRIVHN